VDGYATLAPGSIAALVAALARTPRANAATGLPSAGRSATRQREGLLRNGGLHGSLHALPGHFVARIRAAGLRLPVGLYRGDGLIGSFAMHDLDPANAWDTSRVVPVADATWGLPRFNLAQVPKHVRRRVNQARGRLESAAIKEIIYGHTPRNGYAALPTHADAMLLQYLDTHPLARPHWHDLAGRLAVRQLSRPREPSAAQAGCQALLPGEVNPE